MAWSEEEHVRMSANEQRKGNPSALLPFLLFLAIFLGSGIVTKDFEKMPVVVAGGIAAFVALLMNRKASFSKKVDVFTEGAGHPNIILMCMIFLLAGAFSEVADKMGAIDSTVNLGLTFLPPSLLLVGIFVVCCFIALAMGTSVGTIAAVAPVAVGIADETTISVALLLGATIGGSFFGDNLSFISDTTIAATRTQAVAMKDKFIMNIKIVLPAAILTIIILGVLGIGQTAALGEDTSFHLIKVLPYIAVLIAALTGVNVILVLAGGAIFAAVVGMAYGSFSVMGAMEYMGDGMLDMANLVIIAIIIGGMAEVIRYNGGIDYLLHVLTRNIRSKKGAELSISGLVSVYDVGTANNTIAIIMAGPLARDISDNYAVDRRRTASLLDIFSCTFQGILPYGAQYLAAAKAASISPAAILPYAFYPILAGVIGILAILLGFPKSKKRSTADEGGQD